MSTADDQTALLDFFHDSFSADIGLLSGQDLATSRVSTDPPLPIDDLNGHPLFADYAILDGEGRRIGTIRSSARGEALPLIDSIMIGTGAPFDAAGATAAAIQAAAAQTALPVTGTRLVCYGYPRIGVLVTCGQGAGTASFVYDASSGALVRRWEGALDTAAEAGGGAAPSPEGLPFYSLLGALPEAGGAGMLDAAAQEWQDLRAAMAKQDETTAHAMQVSNALTAPSMPTIRFSISGTVLPLSLEGQQSEVFCAIATAEMMLSFVGIEKTQDEIATVMQPGPFGTLNPAFVAGFDPLSANTLQAEYKANPTFEDFKAIVEQRLPAKSGIPAHARALRGWRQYTVFDAHGAVLSDQKFLVVNDPYPVGRGQFTLENVSKPIPDFYTNVVSVKRSAPLSA